MSKLTKALTAAAGNAAGESLYVEDVFSTYLYTGTGASSQPQVNGINFTDDDNEGMLWLKIRNISNDHYLYDTLRGSNYGLIPNGTNGQVNFGVNGLSSFNSDGFTVGNYRGWGESGNEMTSWSFRKAEKFFDVVTYTGATGPVAHNLGSVPKLIMIKAYSGTYATNDWMVYHADVGAPFLNLNDSGAAAGNFWTTSITDTHFTPPGNTSTNGNGTNYVAYLFASDAGGFGDDGSESIIKCGSYVGNGGALDLNLGFEPQWFLSKCTSTTGNWNITDNMRGFASPGSTTVANKILQGNTNSTEQSDGLINPTATGMATTYGNLFNESGKTYIYIAIRRPMKTPESGTEVFSPIVTNSAAGTKITTNFAVDHLLATQTSQNGTYLIDRINGVSTSNSDTTTEKYSLWASNAALANNAGFTYAWDNDGFKIKSTKANTDEVFFALKRATGFFDTVRYKGNGGSAQNVNHNLKSIPEFIMVKDLSQPVGSLAYHKDLGNTKYLNLTNTAAVSSSSTFWNNTSPTSSVFSVNSNLTYQTDNFIAYLFSSLDGVSKVGSYTGTASDLNVDCGFSAGARFVLIKRSDSSGNWYIWNSASGIVSGTEPYLRPNFLAANEFTGTDYIDPLASGFTITSSAPAELNASGGTYIFLAIA